MFDTFKMMGAVAALLKDKGRVEAAIARTKEAIEAVRADGEAGGGAVRATATGTMAIERVELDPALASGLASGGEAKDMAEKLIEEATTNAIRAAQDKVRLIIEQAASELGVPEIGTMAAGLIP